MFWLTGSFVIDVRQRRLLRQPGGEVVPLTSRAFDLLLHFCEHAGEVLDKDALLAAIWPGLIVEENSLAQNISALRQALGDGRGDNRYIVTLPRKGYQFVADVRRSDTFLPAAADPTLPERPGRRWGWGWLVAVAVTTIAAIALIASLPRKTPAATPIHLSLTLPAGQLLSGGDRNVIAISPDGQHIAYVGTPGGLYVRALAEDTPRAIPGVSADQIIGELSFSPDSRSIVFHTLADGFLKRIAIEGGSPVVICRTTFAGGVSWQGNEMYFVEPGVGIMRVSAAGGEPRLAVKLNPGQWAQSPSLLPDGEHLLFSLAQGSAPDRWDRAQIVLHSLRSGERRTLLNGGSDARYLPTRHIVYASGGSLFAVSFDPRQLLVTSAPVAVVSGVRRGLPEINGTAQYSFSANGTLVYLAGPPSALYDLAVSALGEPAGEPMHLAPARYEAPRASPDGKRIAVAVLERERSSVWIQELAPGVRMKRLTQDGISRYPVWSSDGRRVAYWSDRPGFRGIVVQALDGSRAAPLTIAPEGEEHEPESWRGNTLLFHRSAAEGSGLYAVDTVSRSIAPIGDVRSAGRTGAVLSQDGRWLAYAVGGEARQVVYVQPVPPTGTVIELPEGANHPVWAEDGRSLYFVPGPGRWQVVPFNTGAAPAFGAIREVPRAFGSASRGVRRPFDILPGGRLVFPVPADEGSSSGPSAMQVVLNWFEELRRLVAPTESHVLPESAR